MEKIENAHREPSSANESQRTNPITIVSGSRFSTGISSAFSAPLTTNTEINHTGISANVENLGSDSAPEYPLPQIAGAAAVTMTRQLGTGRAAANGKRNRAGRQATRVRPRAATEDSDRALFTAALDQFYRGEADARTLELLR